MACVETGITLLHLCPHSLPDQDAAYDCHRVGTELFNSKEDWMRNNRPEAHRQSTDLVNMKKNKRVKKGK